MPKDNRIDLYEQVTSQIIAALEAGTRPWSPSWATATLPLRSNRIPYRGINIMLLWASTQLGGYSSPYWFTFKQAKELGGCVRKGEKGSMVVYSNTIVRDGETDGDEKVIPFLKRYVVFNLEQIDGLEDRYPAPALNVANSDERSIELDAAFERTGIALAHGGHSAFYRPSTDSITLPAFGSFRSADAYYATLAHEMIHATGHKTRLGRDTLANYSTSDCERAKEELIAEIGAAYLCAALGTAAQERDDHASYIASWLKVLRNDKRAIFKAATAAQAASDCVLALMGNHVVATDTEAA